RIERFGLMNGFASITTKCLADQAAGNAAQPGAKLVPFAQQSQVFPGGNERFLSKILALTQAAGGAIGQRTNQRLIPGNDLPKRIRISLQSSTDQLSIGYYLLFGHAVRNHIIV